MMNLSLMRWWIWIRYVIVLITKRESELKISAHNVIKFHRDMQSSWSSNHMSTVKTEPFIRLKKSLISPSCKSSSIFWLLLIYVMCLICWTQRIPLAALRPRIVQSPANSEAFMMKETLCQNWQKGKIHKVLTFLSLVYFLFRLIFTELTSTARTAHFPAIG